MANVLDTQGRTISGDAGFFEAFDVIRHSAAEPLSPVSLAVTGGGALNLAGELGAVAATVTLEAAGSLVLGAGDDSIVGSAGNDTLRGDAGNDRIEGGGGTDTLYGGLGDDDLALAGTLPLTGRVDGGLGIDTLHAGTASLRDVVLVGVEVLSLDRGAVIGALSTFDSVDSIVNAADPGGPVTLRISRGGTADLSDELGSTDARFEFSAVDAVSLVGGAGDDRLIRDLALFTSLRFDGGSGDDAASGSNGNDTLWGGAGNDTLSGGIMGRDSLYGGTGNDTIRSGVDGLVDAGAGNDVIDLGTGTADSIQGGSGRDTLTSFGDVAFGVAVAGIEVIDAKGGRIFAPAAGLEAVGSILNSLDPGGVIEITVRGGGVADLASELGSRDARLVGDTGADALVTGGGDDRLEGLGGADLLDGRAGRDTLAGGGGDDVFVFVGRGAAGDVILDFSARAGNDDALRLDASGFGGGLSAGALAASQFRARADNVAQDADDRFLFRTTDETLWFDANGSGSGGLTLVADLQDGARLTAADLVLV